MVRPVRHERHQHLTVRPELVEGFVHRFLNSKIFLKVVFALFSIIISIAWAEEPTENREMTSHDHQGMDHSKMMPNEPLVNPNTIGTEKPSPEGEGWVRENKPSKKRLENPHPNFPYQGEGTHAPKSNAFIDNRDPHAYTDGNDYSGLSKPLMGDSHNLGALIVDRLEGVSARDDFSMTYDWQVWYGRDYDKLVVRAEGEIDRGTFKNNRNEALWGHALTAFWDTQLGVRIDSGLGTDRVWGAFGVQGFAPYWIYIEATAYVGEEGRTAFRLETEYDVLITQKLILQPRIEMNFYSDNDSSRLVSSGLSNIEAGLRLRYEIEREFAPYIGIEWASTFGSAADAIRSQGHKPEETRFVAGVHFWF